MNPRIKSVIREAACTALSPLEHHLLATRGQTATVAHTFILGAPRSGTSLAYEVLITRFRFAYFSNLAHRLYRTPVAATRLGRAAIRNWTGEYSSDYGHIHGWGAPNDGGWIWNRWLEDGGWQDERVLKSLQVEQVRQTVAAMSQVLDAPFLNKNVMHSVRIRLLDALFPGCLFIEIRRDPREIVRSIVRAQRKQRGPALDADGWFSVKPRLARDFLDADLITRSCIQVLGVGKDIERDMADIGAERLLRISHTRVCADPEAVAQDVRGFFSRHGIALADNRSLPERFSPPPSRPLANEDEARISETLGAIR